MYNFNPVVLTKECLEKLRIKSFKGRIVIYFTILIVVLQIILGGVSLYLFVNSLNKKAISYTATILGQARMHIDTYFWQMRTSLETTSRSSILIENVKKYLNSPDTDMKIGLRQGIVKLLVDVKNQNSDINDIIVYLNRDSFMDATSTTINPSSPYVRDIWESRLTAKSLKGQFYGTHLSDYYFEANTTVKSNVISAIVPIRELNANNVFSSANLGIVVFDFQISRIQQILENIKMERTGFTFIIDDNRKPIYIPISANLSNGNYEKDFGKTFQAEKGSYTSLINGKRYLVIFDTLSTTGWKVIAVIPEQDIWALSARQRNFTLLLITFGIALSVSFSDKIAGSIVRPLMSLIDEMKRVEWGHFETRLPTTLNQDEEILVLHASFNSMIETIDSLIKDVYQVRIKQREAEYEALQAKINPHFLYNTLQTISSLAMLERNQEIGIVITALANLLEYSIYEQHEMVWVEQEIDYLKNYIDIQNYKFNHSIEYRIEVEPEVQKAYIFKFMLQPVIENAILHGLATREGKRLILIQGRLENSTVVFKVYDNGVGINQFELQQLITKLNTVQKNDDEKSIGLKNVYDRIRLKFGEEFGIKVESQQGIFTCIEIVIPYIQNRR